MITSTPIVDELGRPLATLIHADGRVPIATTP